MTLQRIIEEIENIMDQASADDDIGKDSILEALTEPKNERPSSVPPDSLPILAKE